MEISAICKTKREKEYICKHCTLIQGVHGVQGNNFETTVHVSTVVMGVISKQGEEASMIYVLMD